MMARKKKRLAMIAGGMGVVALAAFLVLVALRDEIVFFHSPSDIAEEQVAPGTRIRLGGLVAEGSVVRGEGTVVSFAVEDGGNSVPVRYDGILPDLFSRGAGRRDRGQLRRGRRDFRRGFRSRQA